MKRAVRARFTLKGLLFPMATALMLLPAQALPAAAAAGREVAGTCSTGTQGELIYRAEPGVANVLTITQPESTA
jgi:hypothetical protein